MSIGFLTFFRYIKNYTAKSRGQALSVYIQQGYIQRGRLSLPSLLPGKHETGAEGRNGSQEGGGLSRRPGEGLGELRAAETAAREKREEKTVFEKVIRDNNTEHSAKKSGSRITGSGRGREKSRRLPFSLCAGAEPDPRGAIPGGFPLRSAGGTAEPDPRRGLPRLIRRRRREKPGRKAGRLRGSHALRRVSCGLFSTHGGGRAAGVPSGLADPGENFRKEKTGKGTVIPESSEGGWQRRVISLVINFENLISFR